MDDSGEKEGKHKCWVRRGYNENDTDVEPTDYVLLVEEKPSLSG